MAKSSTSELGGWPVLKNGPVSEGAAFNEMMYRPDPGACYDADLNEELEDLFRKSVARDEFRESDHPRDEDGKFGSKGGSKGGSKVRKKELELNIGGTKFTVETENGKPKLVKEELNEGGGRTSSRVIWKHGAVPTSMFYENVIEKARHAHPEDFAQPELPDASAEKLARMTSGELTEVKRQAREYADDLFEKHDYDLDKLKSVSSIFEAAKAEEARREEAMKQESISARRAAPVGNPQRVKSVEPKFGKVDEKDPLWFIAPHGTQPIIDAARAAGYSDSTIANVFGALKQQGWYGKSEKSGEKSDLEKIALGDFGPAENSLLRSIGEREAHNLGVADREYYRSGSFSDQPIISTTRSIAGALMPTGQGSFKRIGWTDKRPGRDLLKEGYLPFGETFTQGYGEESETLWIKFPPGRAEDAEDAEDVEFRESDHPRDEDGKFGSKGGGHSGHSAAATTSSWMSDLVSRHVPEAAHAPPPTPAQKQAISAVEGFKYSDWIQGVMAEHPHKEDKATKAKYAHAFAEFTDEYYHMLRGVPSEQRRKVSENLAHVAKLPYRVLLHLIKEEGVEAAGAGRALYSMAVHGKAPDTEDLNHLKRLGIKLMVVAAGTVLEGVGTEMFTGFALGVVHHALAEHAAKIAGATGRIAHEKVKVIRARDEGEPREEALLRQFIELLAESVAQPLDHAAAQ